MDVHSAKIQTLARSLNDAKYQEFYLKHAGLFGMTYKLHQLGQMLSKRVSDSTGGTDGGQ
jgi:hypothetical protein